MSYNLYCLTGFNNFSLGTAFILLIKIVSFRNIHEVNLLMFHCGLYVFDCMVEFIFSISLVLQGKFNNKLLTIKYTKYSA